MTIRARLEERKDYIVGEYSNGKSTNKLGEEFNCNSGTVYLALKDWGVVVKKRKKFKGKTSDYHDEILRLYDEGNSAYRISKMLSLSSPTVLRFLHTKRNDVSKKCKRDDSNLLKDKTERVVELHIEGKTLDEIGAIVGHAGPSVYRLLQSLGFDTSNTYAVDEHFFDSIDSNIKAYVLGWFYSDGCVDNAGKMRIQIQSGDSYVLDWIKEQMQYEGPLYDVPPPKKFPHRKAQRALCINRKALADNLIKLGCIPNKSLTMTFPSQRQLPKRYWPSFMLGVFDGDGSISRKSNYIQTSITSTEEFLSTARDLIYKPLGLAPRHYFRYSWTNTMSLMTTKTEDSRKLLEYMYREAPFYLTRKFQIFDDWKKTVYNTM
jgi:transposase